MIGTTRCAVFDIDGTLLDGNEARTLAWLEALRDAGYVGVRPQTLRRLIGLGPEQVLALAVGVRHDSRIGREILARRSLLFRRHYLPAIQPFFHVRELVERVAGDGILVAVLAPEPADEVDDLLQVAGIGDLVQVRVTGADALRPIPNPDGLRLAAERAGATRQATLLVGDTPYDVEAGWNAGVGVVALRSGGWGELDLGGALAIYGGAAHLLAEYDASPLGQLATRGMVPLPPPALGLARRAGRSSRPAAEAPQPA
jgi:phosphoglycolate phosphatase-like HAD superfamily hydrolase